jgi:hypothetical protein
MMSTRLGMGLVALLGGRLLIVASPAAALWTPPPGHPWEAGAVWARCCLLAAGQVVSCGH